MHFSMGKIILLIEYDIRGVRYAFGNSLCRISFEPCFEKNTFLHTTRLILSAHLNLKDSQDAQSQRERDLNL